MRLNPDTLATPRPQRGAQLELALATPPIFGRRVAVVVCCEHCRLPHFSHASYMECVRQAQAEGQRDQ